MVFASKPIRIVIVEDERISAAALQLQLEREGYEVVANVDSEVDAVAAARDESPDLFLMDINLGSGGSGISAAADIRRKFNIPVVFVTAYSEMTVIEEAGQAVPYGYLIKPVRHPEIRATVEIAVHRHRFDMERAKLLAQLQDQQEEIETLRGFLPVCAWCRKVRDDQGFWRDMADYVTAHFEVIISHGICSDCEKKIRTEVDSAGS